MTDWDTLLTTALIGTGRRTYTLAQLGIASLAGLDGANGIENADRTSDPHAPATPDHTTTDPAKPPDPTTPANRPDSTGGTAHTGSTSQTDLTDSTEPTAAPTPTGASPTTTPAAQHNSTSPAAPADAVDSVGRGTGAEVALLTAAAIAAGYRRAGWVPVTVRGAAIAPAAGDERPECSATAAQLLELLLERTIRVVGGTELLTLHWLVTARAAGQRPPYRMLVALLRFGTANTATRAVVRDVVGPRGAWLALHNSSWRWAAVTPVEDVVERFRTGARAERLTLLTELRASDPDFARTLVEDTWAAEQASTRAALLDTLHTRLSLQDEPLLESALDDRASTVRAAAAALLDRLPAAARGARMAERATRCLTVGKRGITVELPDEPDAAARRDGITDQREPGYGRAASWLIQILSATPLSTWDTDLIARADHEVITGWTKAALRQRDQDWLAALARHQAAPELLGALDPATGTEILAGHTKLDARFGGLLAATPGPWPAPFSADLVNRLRAARAEQVLHLAAPALAEHLHPSALANVEAWLLTIDTTRGPARTTLRGIAHALTVRATILQEFT